MHEMSEDEVHRMTEYIFAGQKIPAVKMYNDATGVGLKEAKDYIESLERQLRAEYPDTFDAAKKSGRIMPHEMPEDEAKRMTDFIFAGQKIQAIKMYKEASGLGLKESKDFIDDLEKQLRAECPDEFAHAAKTGCGAVVLLGGLLALAAGAVAWA